jgi:hypothetical protein
MYWKYEKKLYIIGLRKRGCLKINKNVTVFTTKGKIFQLQYQATCAQRGEPHSSRGSFSGRRRCKKKKKENKNHGRENHRTHRIDRFNGIPDPAFQFPGNA